MKRLMVAILLVIFMVVPFSTVHAINLDANGPHKLAEIMPDSMDIFMATRIGEDFIAELDAITAAMIAKLPADMAVPPITINDALTLMLGQQGMDWATLSGYLGDHVAVGMQPVGGFNSGEQPNVVLAIEITDQAGIEELILSQVPDGAPIPDREVIGDIVQYAMPTGKIMFTPTHIIATSMVDFMGSADSPLSASPQFTDAMSRLSADNYNIVVYISEATVEAIMNEGDMAALQRAGINPSDAGAVVAGFTILAGNTFTMDIAVQTASPMPGSTVNLDFLSAMPGTADAFIVATDLTNVANGAFELGAKTAEANGDPDPREQISQGLAAFMQLDLDQDVLSWTTGSYGVFVGADLMGMIDEMMSSGTIADVRVDAGIVIEATDVAAAQNLATKIGNFITMMGGSNEEVTISQIDINGVAATSIVVAAPLNPGMPPLEIEFVLTATDDFFFLGTRSAFDAVMAGDTLAANADFAKATQYFLDNPTSVSYMNSDGVVVGTVVPLAMAGPAIGRVFDNIVGELGGSSGGSGGMGGNPMGMMGDPTMMIGMLEAYNSILSSMTLTTSVDDGGVVRIRGTISINP